jgi:type IV pilus assembly protein PilC
VPLFYYKARNGKGELVTGELESPSAEDLKENLSSEGMIPILVKEMKPGGASLKDFADWFGRVKPQELMIFTRQFYTLFKAGISMDTILSTLEKQVMSRKLRSVISKVRTDISGGATLSQAFSRHPKVFNELYVSMLKAGEEAGILEQVLYELVKLIEKEEEIKKNIKSAILYPKIVIVVLVLAVGVLMTFVVPKFTNFYSHYVDIISTDTL